MANHNNAHCRLDDDGEYAFDCCECQAELEEESKRYLAEWKRASPLERTTSERELGQMTRAEMITAGDKL